MNSPDPPCAHRMCRPTTVLVVRQPLVDDGVRSQKTSAPAQATFTRRARAALQALAQFLEISSLTQAHTTLPDQDLKLLIGLRETRLAIRSIRSALATRLLPEMLLQRRAGHPFLPNRRPDTLPATAPTVRPQRPDRIRQRLPLQRTSPDRVQVEVAAEAWR